MELKEIKRTTCPEAHYCNLGNNEVDKMIKNPIYILSTNKYVNGYLNYYEWILWECLSNIKEITRGGFSIIYKATLIDGLINKRSIRFNGEYQRNGEREYGTVTNFAEHGDMRKYLSTNFHSTSREDKLSVVCCIAFGLSKIHSSGMSILETSDYVNHEATTTAEKIKIYGVIPYIPPEFCPMLLWELATGKPSFHDRSHDHILIMITSPLISPSIAKIIKKCWDVNPENRPIAKEIYEKLCRISSYSSEFMESDKYIKENVVNNDSTTKPLGKFSKYIKFLKKIKKPKEITKPSTTTTRRIHPGAVYTSRLFTIQMVDLSKG
ncbi:hypothetical protein G9A89_009128 [Geosiphon pyriformis]|nr:hypothetical protein G9A89_009128 [Geosiphon pyriformis]